MKENFIGFLVSVLKLKRERKYFSPLHKNCLYCYFPFTKLKNWKTEKTFFLVILNCSLGFSGMQKWNSFSMFAVHLIHQLSNFSEGIEKLTCVPHEIKSFGYLLRNLLWPFNCNVAFEFEVRTLTEEIEYTTYLKLLGGWIM